MLISASFIVNLVLSLFAFIAGGFSLESFLERVLKKDVPWWACATACFVLYWIIYLLFWPILILFGACLLGLVIWKRRRLNSASSAPNDPA